MKARANKRIQPLTDRVLVPNEASLLRLASAVLAEVSEDWETGRVYPSMESE